MWKPRVITTDAIPIFLQRGGKLTYRPLHSPRGWTWELWALHPDGKEEPIINSKSGEDRIFKSADALVAFHMRIFPDAKFVPVPVPEQSTDDDSDK